MIIEEETLDALQRLSDYVCNQNLINDYPELQGHFLNDLYEKFNELIDALVKARAEAMRYSVDFENMKNAFVKLQTSHNNIMKIIDEALDDEDECRQSEASRVSAVLEKNTHIIKTQQEEIIKLREKCKQKDSQKDTDESVSEEFFSEIKEKAYKELTDAILRYPSDFSSIPLNDSYSNITTGIVNYIDSVIEKIRDKNILDLHPELDSYIPIRTTSSVTAANTSSVYMPYYDTMSEIVPASIPYFKTLSDFGLLKDKNDED